MLGENSSEAKRAKHFQPSIRTDRKSVYGFSETSGTNNQIKMKDLKDQLYLDLNKKENEVEILEVQEDEKDQEEDKQVLYNYEFELDKSAKIQGSPIFSEDEIPLNAYKTFEPILKWSKFNIVKNNCSSEDLVEPKIFRVWAEQFLIHPLLEPEYSTWVMTAEGESLCTILMGLSESQLDSFSKFYSHHLDKNAVERYWEDNMTTLGVELLTRIGVLRLGKARIETCPRTWIGRRSEESSPQIKFAARGHDCSKVANKFIKKFVGEDGPHIDWEIGYRGGLWRIIVDCPKDQRVLYIEEYEDTPY